MGHPCEGLGVNFQIFEILSLIGSAGGSIALIARPLAGPVGQAKDQCKKISITHHCPNHTFVSICQWFPFVCKKRRSLCLQKKAIPFSKVHRQNHERGGIH
jgi:hypothetical protein